jgi:hypothetical protein
MPVAASLTETSHQLNIACPLYDKHSRNCQQSSTPAPLQRSLCQTDEHDACPIYLSYLLRRTRMMRCDNDWLDAC